MKVVVKNAATIKNAVLSSFKAELENYLEEHKDDANPVQLAWNFNFSAYQAAIFAQMKAAHIEAGYIYFSKDSGGQEVVDNYCEYNLKQEAYSEADLFGIPKLFPTITQAAYAAESDLLEVTLSLSDQRQVVLNNLLQVALHGLNLQDKAHNQAVVTMDTQQGKIQIIF